MIEEASLKHNINSFLSAVIGDKISDVELAHVCGARGILVKTGYGTREAEKLSLRNYLRPEYIADNLLDGVKYLSGS
jgi:D-glycero-D-manno-heptose 1,7-bisphosphate phosphatase